MHTLTYGSESVRYQICHVPRRKKSIAIHVNADGSVQVDAPARAGLQLIHEAVQKRARWVIQHVQKTREQRKYVLPREYVSGESYYYQGNSYPLRITKTTGKESVKLLRGQFQILARDTAPERIKTLLREWYRSHAKEYFAKRLADLSDKMPWVRATPEWKLRSMIRQWGNCSGSNKLTLNPHLIKAPRECIEYVLIHELCHIKEHNHSPRFYRLLSEQLPNWKATKTKLDGMSELLLNE